MKIIGALSVIVKQERLLVRSQPLRGSGFAKEGHRDAARKEGSGIASAARQGKPLTSAGPSLPDTGHCFGDRSCPDIDHCG